MGYRLKSKHFDNVITELSKYYDIMAPALMPFNMRHSDQKVTGYRKIESLKEIVIDEKTYFSPKEILFPPRETMLYFTGLKIKKAEYSGKKKIILLRACDLNGIERIRDIFLNNGNEKDIYFKRRFEKTKFWLMECDGTFDNCFCVSMNSNMTDSYSTAIKFTGEDILIDSTDNMFSEIFNRYGIEEEYHFSFIEENKFKVTVPLSENIDPAVFDHKIWQEYTERCIACGRCNTSCITCSCFTVHDIIYDENKKRGERRRVWAGCHLNNFSVMAGGHDYRTKNGERMRFKTMHKIYDYHKRFGKHMCVGCGRCNDVCPEYISFSKCINDLSGITEKENN